MPTPEFTFTPEFEEQIKQIAATDGYIVALKAIRAQSGMTLAQAKAEFERIVGYPAGYTFQRNNDGTVTVLKDGKPIQTIPPMVKTHHAPVPQSMSSDDFEDGTPLPEGWTRWGNLYESGDGARVFLHGDGYNVARGPVRQLGTDSDEVMAERRRLVCALDGFLMVELDQLYGMRDKARRYLLPNHVLDADTRATIQHDTASAILAGTDPTVLDAVLDAGQAAIEVLEGRVRVEPGKGLPLPMLIAYGALHTLIQANSDAKNFLETGFTAMEDDGQTRSYLVTVQRQDGQTPGQMITDLKGEVARLSGELGAAKEAPDRLRAVYLAEIGRQGLPGWVWNRTHGHWERTYPDGHKAEVWPSCGTDGAGFAIRRRDGEEILINVRELDPNPIWEGGTDALDGMEAIDHYATVAGWITPICEP